MSISMTILTVIAGLFFGLVSALYANKSAKEVRGMTLSPLGWAIPVIIGGALALLYALTQNVWIFVIALVALTLLQIINREGKARRASWNALAIEASLFLFLSAAEDATSPMSFFWIIFPIAAPFIVGAIRTALLNRAPEDGTVNNGAFYKTLALCTCTALVVIGAVGVGVWALK